MTARDEQRHSGVLVTIAGTKSIRYSGPVGFIPVLAHLALALDANDRKAETDNSPEL